MRFKSLGLKKNRRFALTMVREWAKKITCTKPRQNTAEEISHQLWPISLKIGPNDILREYFATFYYLYAPRSQKK